MLTMLLYWTLVTANCNGEPERDPRYEVRFNATRLIGYTECCESGPPCDPLDPTFSMCPIYTPFSWTQPVNKFLPPFDTGERDLGPGEILTYEVTTIDAGGNRDCGATP